MMPALVDRHPSSVDHDARQTSPFRAGRIDGESDAFRQGRMSSLPNKSVRFRTDGMMHRQ